MKGGILTMFNISNALNRAKSKKAGFTLVEILVVILIIGLLFVFLVPKIDSSTMKARETGIKTDFRSYQTAFESVARENSGLGSNAIGSPADVVDSVNGYLDPALKLDLTSSASAKKDPWNNAYKFDYLSATTGNTNNGVITIYTMGKNGVDEAVVLTAVPTVDTMNASVAGVVGEDEYVLATACVDGQIFSATGGFTTNISAN